LLEPSASLIVSDQILDNQRNIMRKVTQKNKRKPLIQSHKREGERKKRSRGGRSTWNSD